VLASYNAKATFFITGNNMGKGQIDIEETGYPAILRRMHADGHQIAAHTWTHQNLTQMNEAQLINQMHYNEMAFRNVLGFFPTYMRPPYSECNETCQAIMKKLGYHITYYSVVTEGSLVIPTYIILLRGTKNCAIAPLLFSTTLQFIGSFSLFIAFKMSSCLHNVSDYLYDDPNLIWKSKEIWDQALAQPWVNTTNVNLITISHDIHYQSAYNLTNYMLDSMRWLKYGTSVTVGECLGDPKENWYRTASGAPPADMLVSLTVVLKCELFMLDILGTDGY
jgi:peptidoglycan/xylan/chitin deacetylase (PgdA/CDA1 family)